MDQRGQRDIQLVRESHPTDQAVIEEAFRLWVSTGRSARLVADAVGCSRQTVYNWIERYNWEERRKVGIPEALGPAAYETAVALRLAAYNAAVRMQQLTADALETGKPVDPKEMAALAVAVDRGGYSHIGRNKLDTDNPNSQPAQLEELTGLTTAELIAREREYASRSNPPRQPRDR